MKTLAYLFNFFFLTQFAFLPAADAQTEENATNEDNQIKIHIKKNVNGEVTESTSTFSLDDLDLDEMLKELDIEMEGLEKTLKEELKDLELDVDVQIEGLDDQIKEMKKTIRIEMDDVEEDLFEWNVFDEGPHKQIVVKSSGGNKALLGVVPQQSENDGVLVGKVIEGSAAEEAGMKPGDIITKVNDDPINDFDGLVKAIGQYNPEEPVRVTFLRDGTQQSANAVLKAAQQDTVFEFEGNENVFSYGPWMPRGGCEDGMKKHMKQMMHHENKAFLGVIMDESFDGNGVKIKEVVEGSAAEKAGLQAGDVITQINKDKVGNVDGLIEVLRPYQPGEQVDVKWERDGKRQKSSAVLGSHKEYKMSKAHQGQLNENVNVWVEKRPFLGVTTFQNVSDDGKVEGVTVVNVMPNTAAEAAGLQKGDIIKSINDVKVEGPGHFAELICDNEVNDEVRLLVMRDAQPVTINATLKERSMNMMKCFKTPGHGSSSNYMFGGEGIEFDVDIEEIDDGVHVMKFKSEDGEDAIKKVIKIKIDADREGEDAIREIDVAADEPEMAEEVEKSFAPEVTQSNLPVRNFSFFPNPNEGKFNLVFNLDQAGDTEIKIFDSEGRVVFMEKLENFSGKYDNMIDISESAKGIYLLQIRQGERVLNEQIVIQ